MSLTALLIIGLLILIIAALSMAVCILYRRWRRGQRLAVMSEQSRASRVRAETAKQVLKRQHFFISRYVHYLEPPAQEIATMAAKICEADSLASAKNLAKEIQLRNRLLLQSVETMRDYAALERGAMTLQLEPFSSRYLLEDAISTMRTFLKTSHQHLLMDISGWQEQQIIVDHGKFCTMLGHLAHAIANYLPKDCNIYFTAESIRSSENRTASWLRLSDNDTNYELPSNEHLFDPLGLPLRSEDTMGSDLQMPALDLPFARHLAELMGGKLNLRRTATGHAVDIELFFTVAE